MFIRATEGVFITLAPHKDLFLTRKNYIEDENGEKYKVFEAVTCTHCHSLYLIGTIENNYLVQKASIRTDELREAFFLGDQVNDSDEDASLKDSELSVEEFELCPHCGFLRSAQQVHKQSCGHNENHFIKVIKATIRKVLGPEDKLEYSIMMDNDANRPVVVKLPWVRTFPLAAVTLKVYLSLGTRLVMFT